MCASSPLSFMVGCVLYVFNAPFSHIPPPHSAVNSSFALPLVQSDLNSSFALPPTHSALLPVNDISPKQPPVHHSVTLGHVFNAPNHQPRTPIDQLTERELSLVAEVNRLHAQLRRQEQQSQQPPPDVPAVAVRLSLIQTAASVSEGERDQAPTAAETETTNREHAVATHNFLTPSLIFLIHVTRNKEKTHCGLI